MAIKDLRKQNEELLKVEEAKELLESKGFIVVEEGGEIEIDESQVVKQLTESGALVIEADQVEAVEEAMKEKVIESLKEEGFQILDEEMLDAIDEELEAIVAEKVEEACKKKSEGEDGEDGEKDGEDGEKDGEDGEKDGEKDGEVVVKKETKESFLESLIDGPAPEKAEKAEKKSFLESLAN